MTMQTFFIKETQRQRFVRALQGQVLARGQLSLRRSLTRGEAPAQTQHSHWPSMRSLRDLNNSEGQLREGKRER